VRDLRPRHLPHRQHLGEGVRSESAAYGGQPHLRAARLGDVDEQRVWEARGPGGRRIDQA
jgi:hypothetical protein